MAAGDLTCTLIGAYDTLELAIAAVDAENLPLATDTIEIFLEAGIGKARYHVVKTVRAAA